MTQNICIMLFDFYFFHFLRISEGFSFGCLQTNKLYNIFMINVCLVRCFVVCWPVGLTAAPVFTPRD